MIAGLALVGFQGAVMPLVLSQHEDPATRINLAHLFRIFCAVALGAILLLSAVAAPAVRLLAAPEYSGAAAIAPVVVVATLLGGMSIFAPGLIVAKRTGLIALIAASSGVLNAVLAFAAVPFLGIQGAAIAARVSSTWYFGTLMYFSQRVYHVPHRWWRIAAAAGLVATFVVIGQTTVSSGRAGAFAASGLIIHGVLLCTGTLALVWLLIDRNERAITQRFIGSRMGVARTRVSLFARAHR